MQPALHHTMQDCIDLCQQCHDTCVRTLYQHCLQLGRQHADPNHVQLMTDCIAACQISADFMLRGSGNHALFCNACAEICEECAESCQALGGKEMESCAAICHTCSESCREMAGAEHSVVRTAEGYIPGVMV